MLVVSGDVDQRDYGAVAADHLRLEAVRRRSVRQVGNRARRQKWIISMRSDNFAHSSHRLCTRAGLGHWTPHELRHSAASIMLAHRTPPWIVSEVLGHASVVVTKDVQGHLIGNEKREATEAITGALLARTKRDACEPPRWPPYRIRSRLRESVAPSDPRVRRIILVGIRTESARLRRVQLRA